MKFKLRIDIESWPLAIPFRITGHAFDELNPVVVTLEEMDASGVARPWGSIVATSVPK